MPDRRFPLRESLPRSVLTAVVAVGLVATATGAPRPSGASQPARPAPPASPAEPAEAQPPVFRTGVDLLAVDVAVLDERGRVVPDLRPPEFTVKIDGEERRIQSFEFIAFGTRRGSDPGTDRTVTSNAGLAPGRLIVLVVDQGHIRSGTGRGATMAAARFLRRLNPEDRVMFAAIPEPGLRVEFTTDRGLIERALERTVGRAGPLGGYFNISLYEALALRSNRDPFALFNMMERECGTIRPGSIERERCEREVAAEADAIAAEVFRRTGETVRALERLLLELRFVDGPKTLLLLSEGLVVEGLGADVAELGALAAGARTSIYVLLLDVPRYDVTQAEAPPTPEQDRRLETEGLEMLAGAGGGTVFRSAGTGEEVYERIVEELGGYYLLGVETTERDRDGRRRRIQVEVRRRGVQVRARREFRWGAGLIAAVKPADRIARALRASIAARELPLRVTSYLYRDRSSKKGRLTIAAELGLERRDPAPMTVGFALFDQEGRPVAAHVEETTLAPRPGFPAAPLEYLASALVEPGTYTLRLAAVDSDGRLGSVERRVNVWDLAGEELGLGDLLLVTAAQVTSETIRPGVEPSVADGRLGAYTELYAARPDVLAQARVEFDVAEHEDGPPLVRAAGRLAASSEADRQTAQATLSVDLLPPGAYVARVWVRRGDQIVGKLARPFTVLPRREASSVPAATPGGEVSAAPPRLPALLPAGAPFDRAWVLAAPRVASLLDLLAATAGARRPAVQRAIARARQGDFAGTGRAAFDGGDQLAAAFLRGLELFAANQLDAAARQFQVASSIDPTFAPATVLLGACFAAAGRDREAISLWQRALGTDALGPLVAHLLADAWLRLGDPTSIVKHLHDGPTRWPDDDGLRRAVGLAQLALGRGDQGLATLEPYLDRHPSDQDVLFLVLRALYDAHAAQRPLTTAAGDAERFVRYAALYAQARGPHLALVEKWRAAIGGASR